MDSAFQRHQTAGGKFITRSSKKNSSQDAYCYRALDAADEQLSQLVKYNRALAPIKFSQSKNIITICKFFDAEQSAPDPVLKNIRNNHKPT